MFDDLAAEVKASHIVDPLPRVVADGHHLPLWFRQSRNEELVFAGGAK